MTLICDRDLMNLDATNLDVDACEKILATLLLSDWNLRAWTLLEAMRGRNALHLLCLEDKTVRLVDILQTVHQRGRIDIALPLLSRPYLLPPAEAEDHDLFDDLDPIPASEEEIHLGKGFITVDEAAVLLSHRHATRDEDDIVIWNLLIGEVEHQDVIDLWKGQIGKKISTGALVSSAPRLHEVPGFRWAPRRPAPARRTPDASLGFEQKNFPAMDGSDAGSGTITPKGLRARWLTFKFDLAMPLSAESDDLNHKDKTSLPKLADITECFLAGFALGILLQVCLASGPRDIPLPYRGSHNHILVVCGSHDGDSWEWQGIFEWDRSCPLPKFLLKVILLT